MSTSIEDAPTVSQRHAPASSTSYEPLEEEDEVLDEEQQEEIILKLEAQARRYERFYRLAFAGAGVVLSLLFFWFAYSQEDFGEALPNSGVTGIIHFLSAIGFLAAAIRVVFANQYITINQSGVEEIEEEGDSAETTVQLQANEPGYLFKVYAPRIALYTIVAISVIEILYWLRPLYSNFVLLFEKSFPAKLQVLIVPMMLPIYFAACEYALSLLVKTLRDVDSLHSLKYKYKRA